MRHLETIGRIQFERLPDDIKKMEEHYEKIIINIGRIVYTKFAK